MPWSKCIHCETKYYFGNSRIKKDMLKQIEYTICPWCDKANIIEEEEEKI